MKLQKRVVEARLTAEISICDAQYGFMPKTYSGIQHYRCSMLALRILIEKYRDSYIVDLEKAYDRVTERNCGIA